MNDSDAAWYQLELEQRQREEEQQLLKADPDYNKWLDQLENESERQRIYRK